MGSSRYTILLLRVKSMILKYLGYVNAGFTANSLRVLVAAHLSFAKCGALP